MVEQGSNMVLEILWDACLNQGCYLVGISDTTKAWWTDRSVLRASPTFQVIAISAELRPLERHLCLLQVGWHHDMVLLLAA